MKAGKYSIKELFNNRYVDQVVIPEIQRDYVWGSKEVNGLLSSICEDFDKYFGMQELIFGPEVNMVVASAFREFYAKQVHSCNIGFIYAYNDAEYPGKYFLIDGQQRLTTIYLLLLVLASENDEFRQKFEKLYMFSGGSIIDYRVREASHSFLTKVVSHYTKNGINLKEQSWFHKEYESDQTIESVVRNIEVILQFVKDRGLVNNKQFINYVQDYIEFWYFDTNISEQGEELYIYMNARGEQMQENENLKADLLGRLAHSVEKEEWGRKWEKWQQFFWLYRGGNSNADKGFNEFINCLAGWMNRNRNNSKKVPYYTREDFENGVKGKKNQPAYTDIAAVLDMNDALQQIGKYMEGLQFLFNPDFKTLFQQQYSSVSWFQKCLDEIQNIFMCEATNWFAAPTDKNRGTEHNRMVFIWSVLYYLSKRPASTSYITILRVIRFYYVRYKNFNRSVQSIERDVDNIVAMGLWNLNLDGTEEEMQKHRCYAAKEDSQELRDCEQLIWEIEDHPLNLCRDAGDINCSHLIDFNSVLAPAELKYIKHKFYELFPVREDGKLDKRNCRKLANILLFYGEFWHTVSPWYYKNHSFENWAKIIRQIHESNNVFKLFFDDYQTQSLDELYKRKVVEFEIDKCTTDLRAQLKWFATKLGEGMWKEGLFIAIKDDTDAVFPNSGKIYNTKGNFNGGTPELLSNLLASTNLL